MSVQLPALPDAWHFEACLPASWEYVLLTKQEPTGLCGMPPEAKSWHTTQ